MIPVVQTVGFSAYLPGRFRIAFAVKSAAKRFAKTAKIARKMPELIMALRLHRNPVDFCQFWRFWQFAQESTLARGSYLQWSFHSPWFITSVDGREAVRLSLKT
jgi:hypothetical protein